jgi:hypothetical protein
MNTQVRLWLISLLILLQMKKVSDKFSKKIETGFTLDILE